MSEHATATFQIKNWEEEPIEQNDVEPKMTRARVSKSFSGDIEGSGTVEYLMVHRDDGSAGFIGYERVAGRLGGRTGTFVLQHSGTYAAGKAVATWTVVPGSATGELSGLRGQGGFGSEHADEYEMTLDYDFGE